MDLRIHLTFISLWIGGLVVLMATVAIGIEALNNQRDTKYLPSEDSVVRLLWLLLGIGYAILVFGTGWEPNSVLVVGIFLLIFSGTGTLQAIFQTPRLQLLAYIPMVLISALLIADGYALLT